MAENSKIEWTDHTVNLWWGCAKVHTGCKNCYAENLSDVRYKNNLWGEKAPRKRIKSAFNDLRKYQKQAQEKGVQYKIFMGSMMDFFEEPKELMNPSEIYDYTDEIRADLFDNINNGLYPNLIFLFLTKRPRNINELIFENWVWDSPKNVWYGLSVSNQQTVDDNLMDFIANTPSNANRFLSVEPQIGKIDFKNYLINKNDLGRVLRQPIHWIIQGGESGHKKRPFDLNWVYSMKTQCEEYGVPYFFKQIDKIQQIPDDLLIRQFPKF